MNNRKEAGTAVASKLLTSNGFSQYSKGISLAQHGANSVEQLGEK